MRLLPQLLCMFLALFPAVTVTGAVHQFPWKYRGWESLPVNWFGANPAPPGGPQGAEANATLAVMAQHQLVGWGWQQGMYDFPCNAMSAQQCFNWAAQVFAQYLKNHSLPDVPSFVYRHMGGGALNFEDIQQALNCSPVWTALPSMACGLSDPALARLRREWFLHDRGGRPCGPASGGFSMTWQKSAPGAVEYWDEVVGGHLANMTPAAAVFLDAATGCACGYAAARPGNCTATGGFDPAQFDRAACTADGHATVDAIKRVAARLLRARKAVIINPAMFFGSDGGGCADFTFEYYFSEMRGIPNLIWYFEAWNATSDLPTAVYMLERQQPKLIHLFSSNDTEIEYAIAAFLIAQGEYDYFSVSTEWTDGGWFWHSAYDRYRCGRPLGAPVRAGAVYSREFEHCSVRYDMSCPSAARDGCGWVTQT